jgi:hypothetical protein
MPRITELYAWVVADTGPDDEGVPAFMDPVSLTWHPMMGADLERATSLRGEAQKVAAIAGKSVRLLRSVGELEEVDVVVP